MNCEFCIPCVSKYYVTNAQYELCEKCVGYDKVEVLLAQKFIISNKEAQEIKDSL
jgi:hypothetical protein